MVFKRIRDITMATVNEGLDVMENPVSMLNQYLRDMEEEIDKAEEAIVKQTMIQKKFEQYKKEAKHMVDKRVRQATLAVEAGEEELARKALFDKKQYVSKIDHYSELKEESSRQVHSLKEQLKEMKDKYDQMRDRKYELISRANAAKTKKQMNSAMNRFDSDSALKGFQRMEERIMEWETEAEVRRHHSHSGSDSLHITDNDRLNILEPDEDVDRELASMKQSISQ